MTIWQQAWTAYAAFRQAHGHPVSEEEREMIERELGVMGMKFRCVVADPPWRFKCWTDFTAAGGLKPSSASRRVENHYQTREADWISSLPVSAICASDAVLFLWACWPMLPDALRLIESWGFEYKTLGFDWVKKT